uniref:DZF domain-containing protein n=1 Tax=Panagrellus redivivus TaxID=6233 RepID=A0A7E4UUV6_PANRE
MTVSKSYGIPKLKDVTTMDFVDTLLMAITSVMGPAPTESGGVMNKIEVVNGKSINAHIEAVSYEAEACNLGRQSLLVCQQIIDLLGYKLQSWSY